MHDDARMDRATHFQGSERASGALVADNADAERDLALGLICEMAVNSLDVVLVSISLGDRGGQKLTVERGGGDGSAARRLALHDEAWGLAEPLVLGDLRNERRLRHLPEISSDGGFRFYAGVSLQMDDEAVGVLNLYGVNPHSMAVRLREQAERFGLLIEQLLMQHRTTLRLQHRLHLVENAASMSHVGAWMVDLRSGCVSWSRETHALLEVPIEVTPAAALIGTFWTDESRDVGSRLIDALFDRGIGFDEVLELRSTSGKVRRMRVIAGAELLAGQVVRACGSLQPVD